MVVFPNNLPVPMEHLMGQALKATSIIIWPCHVTSETMKILCSQKRQALISYFTLRDIDNSLDHSLFFQFVL
uniref:Ovule protein n=1 Tax=Panagrolaimus sp. PS1159 TaxID=55785 RepID=A0AC35EV74_9BILA